MALNSISFSAQHGAGWPAVKYSAVNQSVAWRWRGMGAQRWRNIISGSGIARNEGGESGERRSVISVTEAETCGGAAILSAIPAEKAGCVAGQRNHSAAERGKLARAANLAAM